MHGQVVGIPREELKDLLQRGDQVRPVNHVKCLRQVQSETDASLQLGLADAQLQLSSGAAVPLAAPTPVTCCMAPGHQRDRDGADTQTGGCPVNALL